MEENVEGEEEGNERRLVGHIGKRWWYLTMTYELLFGAITLLPYIGFYVKIHIFIRFNGS